METIHKYINRIQPIEPQGVASKSGSISGTSSGAGAESLPEETTNRLDWVQVWIYVCFVTDSCSLLLPDTICLHLCLRV